jgi:hypothetical protein
MKICKTLLILVLIAGCGHSQTPRSALTGDRVTDLKILIPEGDFTVDIIDRVIQNPRYQELQNKLVAAINRNKDWFLEQQKLAGQTSEPMPYHPNFGMTEEEYAELITLTQDGLDVEMTKSGSAKVSITYENDLIKFNGTGKLKVLKDVMIDLKENIVLIGDYKLDNFQEINVNTDKNGLKSKWRGYQWRYEYTDSQKNLEELTSAELQTIILKNYKLTIGRLEKDSTTYIEITEREIEKGIKTKTIQIPFKF